MIEHDHVKNQQYHQLKGRLLRLEPRVFIKYAVYSIYNNKCKSNIITFIKKHVTLDNSQAFWCSFPKKRVAPVAKESPHLPWGPTYGGETWGKIPPKSTSGGSRSDGLSLCSRIFEVPKGVVSGGRGGINSSETLGSPVARHLR